MSTPKETIDQVLSEHRVVGVSGLGVEQIMCDCFHTIWWTTKEYRDHVSEKLVEALAKVSA